MPNIISMIKRGESRVPIGEDTFAVEGARGRSGAHVSPCPEQYWPDRSEIIAKLFGRLASENEEEILLKHWRAAIRNTDPETTVRIELAVSKMIESLWESLNSRRFPIPPFPNRKRVLPLRGTAGWCRDIGDSGHCAFCAFGSGDVWRLRRV